MINPHNAPKAGLWGRMTETVTSGPESGGG